MNYSALVERIAGKSVDAWAVHYEALRRAAAGEDIIVLSVGQETSERTPETVVEAAVRSLRAGRHHYTDVAGEQPLREAIARRHTERTGQPVDGTRVAVFSGAQNALFATAQCLLQDGDEVIVVEPYYTTYPATFTASGARLVAVPSRADDGFALPLAAIGEALGPRTRAVVVNSPNNPTGAIYARADLERLVRWCDERDVWLVSDEVYAELAEPQSMVSPCGLPGGDRVCVTVSSVSKSHRMTGWRVGWVVGPETLAGHLYNLAMCMCYGLPMFTQDGALHALREAEGLAGEIRATLVARAGRVRGTLDGLAGTRIFAAGGMFVVLDIRALDVPGDRFAAGLLERHRVSVLPCDGFGRVGEGLVRISLCESGERLSLACERLRRYVEGREWDRPGR